MSKPRRRKGNQKQSSLPKQTSQANHQPLSAYRFPPVLGKMIGTMLHYFWKLVVVISIVAGVFSFFYPRVVVEADQSDLSDNPFSVSFIVTNNSFVPLENVNVAIGICRIRATIQFGIYDSRDPNYYCEDKPHDTLLMPKDWTGHKLESDGKYTIHLLDLLDKAFKNSMDILTQSFKGADISVVTSFQPWILPYRITKEYRFTAAPDSKGKVIWSHQTIDRP